MKNLLEPLRTLLVLITFSAILISFTACKTAMQNRVSFIELTDREYYTDSNGFSFVFIDSGSFEMGSPENDIIRDDDEKLHEVTIQKGFYLQTTELTQRQWKSIMMDNPSRKKNDSYPVESVSWIKVNEFIQKLNSKNNGLKYRLPTEAEWEYACKAGTKTRFSTGDCLFENQANFDGSGTMLEKCNLTGNKRNFPRPVASYEPNRWGLFDMHGNVAEWCQDTYRKDLTTLNKEKRNPENEFKVLRGGSYYTYLDQCRSANRKYAKDYMWGPMIGFRLVAEKQ